MRTIIVLAIGIYLGRQLSLKFDKNRRNIGIKEKLIRLLEQNGITKENAEKEVEKFFKPLT